MKSYMRHKKWIGETTTAVTKQVDGTTKEEKTLGLFTCISINQAKLHSRKLQKDGCKLRVEPKGTDFFGTFHAKALTFQEGCLRLRRSDV